MLSYAELGGSDGAAAGVGVGVSVGDGGVGGVGVDGDGGGGGGGSDGIGGGSGSGGGGGSAQRTVAEQVALLHGTHLWRGIGTMPRTTPCTIMHYHALHALPLPCTTVHYHALNSAAHEFGEQERARCAEGALPSVANGVQEELTVRLATRHPPLRTRPCAACAACAACGGAQLLGVVTHATQLLLAEEPAQDHGRRELRRVLQLRALVLCSVGVAYV